MEALFKNIHNPYVIIFLVLFFISIFNIVWFFFLIFERKKIPFEEWQIELEKKVDNTKDNKILEHMHNVARKEFKEEFELRKTIDKKALRLMKITGIFFIFLAALFPYIIKLFPSLIFPGIKNPMFLLYELYVVSIIMMTLSFFLCYKTFYVIKGYKNQPEASDVRKEDYIRYLRQGIIENAIDARFYLIVNEKRSIVLSKARLFCYIGTLSGILLITGCIVSKFIWSV